MTYVSSDIRGFFMPRKMYCVIVFSIKDFSSYSFSALRSGSSRYCHHYDIDLLYARI